MDCPNCAAEMENMTLDAHLAAPVDIDVCTPCQAFWFDKYESLKLAAGSTLKLMRFIGERTAPAVKLGGESLNCPRCTARLRFTNDLQRSTRFTYWRCEKDHGRFIRFFEFLKEKNFIRPLTPQQIAELRQNIQVLNCSNCGAPIELGKASSCAHCGSAVSMLDMAQPERMMNQLREKDARKMDVSTILELSRVEQDGDWWKEASSNGLVQAGLGAVARWLNKVEV